MIFLTARNLARAAFKAALFHACAPFCGQPEVRLSGMPITVKGSKPGSRAKPRRNSFPGLNMG